MRFSTYMDFLNEDIKIGGKTSEERKKEEKEQKQTPEDNQPPANLPANNDEVPDYGNDPDAGGKPADNMENNISAPNNTDNGDSQNDGEINTNDTGDDEVPDYGNDPDAGGEEPTDNNGDNDNTQDTGTDGDGGTNGDTGEDEVPDYDNSGDDNGDSTEDDNNDEPDPSSMPPDEIKQLEDELFQNLTPEQVAVKKTELKEQYVKLYEDIDKVIEKLSKVERQEESIRPINFVVKKLMEMRDLLKDALTINFKSKSYMENQILLMRFMNNYTILTKIIEELDKSKKNK